MRAYVTCVLLHSSGIFVKINSRESCEIRDNIFFLIIEIFLEILFPNLQPRFDVELLLTRAKSQKHRYNSKRIPQIETTNYLAKKKKVQSIEIRRQTFSVLWVERSVTFYPLAPGLLTIIRRRRSEYCGIIPETK